MRVLPEILNIDTHTGAWHESEILEMSLFVLVLVLFVLKMWTQYCEINVMLGSGQMRENWVHQSTVYIYINILRLCWRGLISPHIPHSPAVFEHWQRVVGLNCLHCTISVQGMLVNLLKWQTLVRWKAAENIERGRVSVLLGIDWCLLATRVNDSEPRGGQREKAWTEDL